MVSTPPTESARTSGDLRTPPVFAAGVDLADSAGNLAHWRAQLERDGYAAEQAPPALFATRGAAAHCMRAGVVALCIGEMRWSDDRLQQLHDAESPASALAIAFSKHGRELLQRLHGSFAFALIDPSRRAALAAIDRMGICSLSFSVNAQAFIVAIMSDAVARHPAIGAAIDPQAIHDYLFCHVVPAPRTIYRGVSKLLPAQFIDWKDGRIDEGYYWRMHYARQTTEPIAALERRFVETLDVCVGAAGGEDRTGAFLSGGTDSSTVTGMLAKRRLAPIDAYSIGFDAQGFDEMQYARIAAEHFAVRHHPYYLTPADVADAIGPVAAAYDEPFGNASAVPTYYCALRAREDGIRCLLAGDGGDEIFGGNERYVKQRVFEWYSRVPGALRAGLLEPLLDNGAARRIPLLRKAASYVSQAHVPLPDRLETYNFLLRDPAASIFEPDFLRQIDVDNPLALAREVYRRTDGGSNIDRMMHLDLKTTLADNDLRKVGRMCALAGVHVRFPMLDDRIVAFSAELPPALRVRGVQLRPFFKSALRGFLPQAIIEKKKHGFGLPFGLWLRSEPRLTKIARDSLTAFGRRGYLRPQYLENLLARHDAEHATYYGVMIWVVMMLEQWLQVRRTS